jgi:hypothetical protein
LSDAAPTTRPKNIEMHIVVACLPTVDIHQFNLNESR